MVARRAALVAVALSLLAPAAAHAHAQVRSTTPAQGAALERGPDRVVFRFTESVETQFGSVRVFDADGRRVDTGATTRPSGSSAAVKVRGGLPRGAYTATYRVVSADSHPVSGGFTFTVGRSSGRSAASVASLVDRGGAGPVTSTAFGVARGLGYAATALLVGGALALWLVWLPSRPSGSEVRDAVRWRVRRIGVVAALVGALASAAGIALQGAIAAGTTVWSALEPGVVGDVLATDFGLAWAMRLVAFLVVAAVVATWPRRGRVAVAVAAAALLVTPAFSGHANATSPRAAMLALDTAHVAAMSAWVGGVAFLVLVLPRATRRVEAPARSALLARVVSRFSTVALVSVGVLVATGVLQSIAHLASFANLTSTGYGRAIVAKSVLALALIGAGALNRQRTLPRLRAAAADGATPGRAGLTLRRAIRGELALMAGAIAVTAALVSYAPPATRAAGPLSESRDLGPARLEITVSPARAGRNEIHLYLFDRRSGAQYDRAKEVTAAASLPGSRIGPIDLDARKTGPGHYTVSAADLVPRGDWRLRVAARVSAFDEYATTVETPIR